MSKSAKEKMLGAISSFITKLNDYPGWKEWQSQKFGYVLAGDDRDRMYKDDTFGDFVFSDEVEAQHKIVMSYMQLLDTVEALKDVEYYFRRFPFHDLPVTHERHLRNVCEMYFSKFYGFRDRAKKHLNNINDLHGTKYFDVGKFLKSYDKEFKQEIKERNNIHHTRSFDDVDIDFVFVSGILPDEYGWTLEQRAAYRRVTKEWAARVRRRSEALDNVQDAIANATLSSCPFLDASPQEGNNPKTDTP